MPNSYKNFLNEAQKQMSFPNTSSKNIQEKQKVKSNQTNELGETQLETKLNPEYSDQCENFRELGLGI